MEALDIFIEKEKKENPQAKEMVEAFFSNEYSIISKIFKEDVTKFIESIEINEEEMKDIRLEHGGDERKSLYRHIIGNGTGTIFLKNKQKSEAIYLRFLKFKQEFNTLNKEQVTKFTKKMIEMYNISPTLKQKVQTGEREYREGIHFQIMIEEMNKIKETENIKEKEF
ncbi:MAG: hypothetical protein WC010_04220 [Candidatus Absconditabacterales bacterium]